MNDKETKGRIPRPPVTEPEPTRPDTGRPGVLFDRRIVDEISSRPVTQPAEPEHGRRMVPGRIRAAIALLAGRIRLAGRR